MIGQMKIHQSIERMTSEIQESPKFRKVNFTQQQFNSFYSTRLELLSSKIHPKQEWKNVKKSDISSIDTICYITGTIYKDMALKPNILDEITREKWIQAPPPRERYTSEKDSIVLEDMTGRVILKGDVLDNLILVTGMVVGVFGKESVDGSYFHVIDITFPSLLPREEMKTDSPTKLAFVSGLGVSSSLEMNVSLLADYLTGDSGLDIDLVSEIQRLIICGNSLALPTTEDVEKRMIKNKFGSLTLQYDPVPVTILDEFLAKVASGLPVDLMPGPSDPASHLLPQQPLHASIFPTAYTFSSFSTTTNPYQFQVNGYDVICTSGQEVEDMIKYTDKEDGLDLRMDIVEMLLKSGHLAPTCPDTLWTLPFPPGQDPFVIERVPDLVVIGNQKFGGSKVLDMNGEKCLVVLVEEFATGGLVVVDCLDLAVDVVGFSNTVEE